MPIRCLSALAAVAVNVALIPSANAGEQAATAGAPPPAAAISPKDALSPKDAGARYGQALGAVEVCFGSKVTDQTKRLENSYSGSDQETFKAQAAKIYEAWRKVKSCADQVDPNRCKIIMDKSCLAAEAEIGAEGNVVPGLVDFVKH